MSVIVISVMIAINITLALAAGVFCYLWLALRRHLKDNPDHHTQLILSDMMRGNALLRIERIAPEDVYLRRQ